MRRIQWMWMSVRHLANDVNELQVPGPISNAILLYFCTVPRNKFYFFIRFSVSGWPGVRVLKYRYTGLALFVRFYFSVNSFCWVLGVSDRPVPPEKCFSENVKYKSSTGNISLLVLISQARSHLDSTQSLAHYPDVRRVQAHICSQLMANLALVVAFARASLRDSHFQWIILRQLVRSQLLLHNLLTSHHISRFSPNFTQ